MSVEQVVAIIKSSGADEIIPLKGVDHVSFYDTRSDEKQFIFVYELSYDDHTKCHMNIHAFNDGTLGVS
jgi:hypothetical protein